MRVLVIGGNRYFGKKLVARLISAGHEVTLLNRQNLDDGFANQVQRIKCDRTNSSTLKSALSNLSFDLVYDQVCYEAQDARSACEIFRDKTSKYIFTSSQSVYQAGANISETAFDPKNYQFTEDVTLDTDYAEAKRQCETVFFKQRYFEVTAVRFTFVFGEGDYRRRVQWHVDRVRSQKEIYFPNVNAQFSMIHSDDAAEILFKLSTKNISGPLNASAPKPISPVKLLHSIQKVIDLEAILAKTPSEEAISPFGVESDWFMSVEKLISAGIITREIDDWLSQLIALS